MQKILEKRWVRIPVGMFLLFSMCVASEFVYNAPANLSTGLTVGTVFALLYLLYESLILFLEFCQKTYHRITH